MYVGAKYSPVHRDTMTTDKASVPDGLSAYLGEVHVGELSEQQICHVYSAEQTSIINDDVLLQENATLARQDRVQILKNMGGHHKPSNKGSKVWIPKPI